MKFEMPDPKDLLDEPGTRARPVGTPALRPKDAATLILLERGRGAPKVLMGRRHDGHKFMPGKFVFPGGRLDPVDRLMSVASPLEEAVERKLLVNVSRPAADFGRALALASIRETFEETGLALGTKEFGAPEEAPEGVWRRFAETGVHPALETLDFLARAITPPGRSKRFDARFFVADASLIAHRIEGVVHAEAELVELVWTPLPKALELDIPRITRLVLADLSAAEAEGMGLNRPRPFYRQLHGKFVREML